MEKTQDKLGKTKNKIKTAKFKTVPYLTKIQKSLKRTPTPNIYETMKNMPKDKRQYYDIRAWSHLGRRFLNNIGWRILNVEELSSLQSERKKIHPTHFYMISKDDLELHKIKYPPLTNRHFFEYKPQVTSKFHESHTQNLIKVEYYSENEDENCENTELNIDGDTLSVNNTFDSSNMDITKIESGNMNTADINNGSMVSDSLVEYRDPRNFNQAVKSFFGVYNQNKIPGPPVIPSGSLIPPPIDLRIKGNSNQNITHSTIALPGPPVIPSGSLIPPPIDLRIKGNSNQNIIHPTIALPGPSKENLNHELTIPSTLPTQYSNPELVNGITDQNSIYQFNEQNPTSQNIDENLTSETNEQNLTSETNEQNSNSETNEQNLTSETNEQNSNNATNEQNSNNENMDQSETNEQNLNTENMDGSENNEQGSANGTSQQISTLNTSESNFANNPNQPLFGPNEEFFTNETASYYFAGEGSGQNSNLKSSPSTSTNLNNQPMDTKRNQIQCLTLNNRPPIKKFTSLKQLNIPLLTQIRLFFEYRTYIKLMNRKLKFMHYANNRPENTVFITKFPTADNTFLTSHPLAYNKVQKSIPLVIHDAIFSSRDHKRSKYLKITSVKSLNQLKRLNPHLFKFSK